MRGAMRSQPAQEFRYGIDPRASEEQRLDLKGLFGNERPVILEIGSGKGRFLVEEAKRNREMNYLGVEKSLHYFRHIADRLERHRLENARIINFDAFPVVRDMLGDATITEIHIYFPDPWPRPRERKRRFVREEVLEQLHRVLQPHGLGIFVTDHREYFEKGVQLFQRFFSIEAGEVTADMPARTNYEAKYREEGRPVYQVVFRRRESSGEGTA